RGSVRRSSITLALGLGKPGTCVPPPGSGPPLRNDASVRDKLGCDEWIGFEAQRGLLGLVAIGNQPSEEMHTEVVGTAVTRVLDLTDILELIDDRFDERPLAEEELVGE